MPIRFPRADEIRLANPPLAEVVCQVRFPPILRIAKEEPVDLQERVRRRFPQLDLEHKMRVKVPAPGSEASPEATLSPRIYRFKNEEEDAFISLAPDFYALTSHNYSHWSRFVEDFGLVHGAVQEIYQPSNAKRVGLRFINHLTFENTGTSSVAELFQLVRPELIAILEAKVWKDANKLVSQLTFVDEANDGQLTYNYGFETADGPKLVLDFDYYQQGNLPLAGLLERLERYHDIIHDVFRWSVLEEALKRFGPVVEVDA